LEKAWHGKGSDFERSFIDELLAALSLEVFHYLRLTAGNDRAAAEREQELTDMKNS
jgi:hypothetical protein